MDMTIEKLKVGDCLIFGKYGVLNEYPQPIPWLKATPNCGFIAEDAIDYICFDARERGNEDSNSQYYGNRLYKLSNVLGFLNSDDEQWYRPTHQADAPPSYNNTDRYSEYESHFGFLYHFEDYEVDSIVYDSIEVGGEAISSPIRLPLIHEIIGPERFKLFHKRGIRPKASNDMIQNRQRTGLDYGSYIDFWVADYPLNESERLRNYAKVISRSGSVDTKNPKDSAGIRPVCRIRDDTPVILGEDGFYHIKPRIIKQNICTDEELFSLLGIMQP